MPGSAGGSNGGAELGAQVRKGAKSELVIFYKEFDVEPAKDATDDDGKRRVASASFVFNAAEVDGFDIPDVPARLGPIARIDAADRFITSTKVTIAQGGERAYYRPSLDAIQMPDEHLFTGTDTMTRDESYYAVLLHELWTSPAKVEGLETEPAMAKGTPRARDR